MRPLEIKSIDGSTVLTLTEHGKFIWFDASARTGKVQLLLAPEDIEAMHSWLKDFTEEP